MTYATQNCVCFFFHTKKLILNICGVCGSYLPYNFKAKNNTWKPSVDMWLTFSWLTCGWHYFQFYFIWQCSCFILFEILLWAINWLFRHHFTIWLEWKMQFYLVWTFDFERVKFEKQFELCEKQSKKIWWFPIEDKKIRMNCDLFLFSGNIWRFLLHEQRA